MLRRLRATRYILTLAIALLAVGPATAEVVKSTVRLAPPLAFDRIGNAEGLPNSNVRAMVQDAQGFLWFATQEGLARYDGVTMRVYRPTENDPSSVSAGYITALALDASGKLWVGTAEQGVNLYDPATDKFTRFVKNPKGGLSSEGVTAIVRDPKNRVWFAMSGGGLNRFDDKTQTFASYQQDPLDTPITALAADAGGSLWLGTATQQVIQWNPENGATATFQPGGEGGEGGSVSPVTSLLPVANGKVWIGTDGEGMFSLEVASKKLTQMVAAAGDYGTLSDDHVTVLFEDRAKNLWIGTTNGLNRMDTFGRIVQYHHDPNDPTSLAFPGVESIFQDAGGVMWIGGFTAGACKFDDLRLKFGHYRTSSHPANSFHEDADGTLWVGTYNGGLWKYELATQKVTVYRALGTAEDPRGIPLEASWISALHRDKKGTLWIAAKGHGLIAMNTTNDSFKQYLPNPEDPNSLPVDTIWDIKEDARGTLWFASWGGGLVRLDAGTEQFKAITKDDNVGLSSDHLYTLHLDAKNPTLMWLGTAKGGLVRYDTAANAATAFLHKNEDPTSPSSDDVLSIYRDTVGNTWFGTYGGGLNRMDASNKVERFTTANGKLKNDVVFGILPDDSGNLWLSTNGGGLIQLDPKTGKSVVYDRTDGVQDNEFGQGSFMRSKAGKLYFGGVGGFNAFLPKDLVRDSYVPPVVLTDFKKFNADVKLARPIWTLPALELDYSDSFELRFAGLSFAAPGKNRYAYKLEGFDEKFIETDRPVATYTKLDGGDYTLRVRASNQHGVWNETGIALKLTVEPPLWRRWYAFVLYGLVLATIIFLFVRYQRDKVRRAEREGRLAVVERDLQLTGAVQSGFLPEANEVTGDRVQVHGYYRAADACSGDWWWHQTLANGQRVVVVGDVTGHGPGPAMVTAAVATAFRVLTENGLTDMKVALDLLNHVVLQVAKGEYQMTMALFEMNEATGDWTLYSAGAPPMMTLNANGKHRVHFCAGAPLGSYEFESGRIEGQLAPSERCLIYTDGIPEISLPNGNVLGMRRFAQLYEKTRTRSLKDAAGEIVKLANDTLGNQVQADDWTFALIEFTAGGEQRSVAA